MFNMSTQRNFIFPELIFVETFRNIKSGVVMVYDSEYTDFQNK